MRRPMVRCSMAAAIAIPWIVAVLAVGCATPMSRFYTLSSTPAPAATPVAYSVAVGPVTIPAVIDATPDRRQHESEPGSAGRVQPLGLAAPEQHWAGGRRQPCLNSGHRPREPVSAVDQRSRRLSRRPSCAEIRHSPRGCASLDAVWTIVRAKDGATQTGRTSVRESSPSGGYDGVAAAHSRASRA